MENSKYFKIKVTNIDYDTDNIKIDLPQHFEFIILEQYREEVENCSYIADLISDNTGFCVNKFYYEEIKDN